MPTYDYECESCGHLFERFQRISEAPVQVCPKCGEHVRRLLGTGAGILFKGSGFYTTDYRSESYRNAAKTDGEKTAPSTTAGPAKTESAGTAKEASGGTAKAGSGKG